MFLAHSNTVDWEFALKTPVKNVIKQIRVERVNLFILNYFKKFVTLQHYFGFLTIKL